MKLFLASNPGLIVWIILFGVAMSIIYLIGNSIYKELKKHSKYREQDYSKGSLPSARITAGGNHVLVLKEDGTVLAFGNNEYGQCNIPENLTGVIDIAAGYAASAAFKSDGTYVIWGAYSVLPANLQKLKAVSLGVGKALTLFENGTVTEWGKKGEIEVLPDLHHAMAIDMGFDSSIALKGDGTVAVWGGTHRESDIPEDLAGVKAIASGNFHCLALLENGTVAAWGDNEIGQCKVPEGLAGVKAIAVGEYFSVALKEDGAVVAWGDNRKGQTEVPEEATEIVSIAAGNSFVVAARADGTAFSWGAYRYSEYEDTFIRIPNGKRYIIKTPIDPASGLKSKTTVM
jgi:alpha-tubulin suppressor-like RCC1 family protein